MMKDALNYKEEYWEFISDTEEDDELVKPATDPQSSYHIQ